MTLCMLPQVMYSQDIIVSTDVSADTILAGERLTITFKVKGGSISDFVPPEFTGFRILAGPNVSSSFSMLNGQVSQEASYGFMLQAISIGDIEIEQAKLTVGEEVFETDAAQIHVLENPDQEIMDSLDEIQPSKKKFKKKRKTFKI